jgi:hypothetical protein
MGGAKMSGPKTVEVPFVTIGGRRCLTDQQLAENSWLEAFVERYWNCFEYDPQRHVWFYKEDAGALSGLVDVIPPRA